MKKLIALLLALVMVMGLVACGAKQEAAPEAEPEVEAEVATEAAPEAEAEAEPEEPALSGEITFATTFNNYADTTVKALAEEFMALHPGTTINVQAIGDLEQEMRIMMAGNQMPDVCPTLPAASMSNAEFADFYMPLDGMFTEDELYGYNYGVGTDGHLYALNSGVSYCGIVYNKAVFKEAGITETPKTMDEFMAACEKIKAIGKTPLASNFKDNWTVAYFAYSYGRSYEGVGNVLNTRYGQDEVVTAGGGYEAGMKWLQAMVDAGYVEADLMSTNWEGSKADMAAGNLAMLPLASWVPAQIIDLGAANEDIGMFPYPDTKSISMSGDHKYAISKDTENPELAWAFLQWLWEDGRFQKAVGLGCPLVGYVDPDAHWLDEITSSGLPVVPTENDLAEVSAIAAETEFNFRGQLVQGYITAEDKDAYIQEINQMWADAQ